MSRQFNQTRIEVDLVAAPFKHHTAQIVKQQRIRNALPVLKGIDVTAQKAFHLLVEEELQIQPPGIG